MPALFPDRFAGRSFVVTGGTGGIGRATADRLHAEGARVLVTGRTEEKLKDAAAAGLDTLANDAADPAAAGALADAVKDRFGALDGAFLNAGFAEFGTLADTTAEGIDRVFAVDVRGVLLHAQALAPLMNDGGSLLFNASVAPQLQQPSSLVYASAKGAVLTAVRVLAKELAPRVRVNAVSPGPVATDAFDVVDDAVVDWLKGRSALGRFADPAELAAVACFLLSEEASYVVGSNVVADGGMVTL